MLVVALCRARTGSLIYLASTFKPTFSHAAGALLLTSFSGAPRQFLHLLWEALLGAADQTAALTSTVLSSSLLEMSLNTQGVHSGKCPYPCFGSQTGSRGAWHHGGTLDTWAAFIPAHEGAQPEARMSSPLPKAGGATWQLRKEGKSQKPSWEKESKPVVASKKILEGVDKLWWRIQTFCQKQNLPCSWLGALSRLASWSAGQHTHSHPLLCWSSSQRQPWERALCRHFKCASFLWWVCVAQKVGQ